MKESSFVRLPKIERKYKVTLKPKQVIYFRCDYELFKKMHKISTITNLSINQLTQNAIEKYVSKQFK